MNTSTILPSFGELLAKSTLIILIAASWVSLWKRASAAHRHAVWCAAICGILLLPLTLPIKPLWSVTWEIRNATISPPVSGETVPPMASSEKSTRSATSVPSAPARGWRLPDWRMLIVVIWAGGAGLLLLRRVVGSVRLQSLRASSSWVEDTRIRDTAAGILWESAIRRPVEVRVSTRSRVPLTWGTWRPVLMLPLESLASTDARLVAALRHEAAHIARCDYLTLWMSQIACALYRPNPLVWLAARALRTAQEQSADDLVLGAGTEPGQYATHLLDVARSLISQRQVAQCAVAMARPSTLEQRILAIIDEHRDRRPLDFRAVIGGIVTLLLVLGFSSSARLLASEAAGFPTATVANPAQAEAAGAPAATQLLTTADADPLQNIVLEKMDFRNAPLSQVVNFLQATRRKKGADSLNIVVVKMPSPEPKLTISLENILLPDAICYVAQQAGLKVRREAHAFVLEEPSSAVGGSPDNGGAAAPRAAADPLQNIVLENMDFMNATLGEAVDFLQAAGRKRGADSLNIVVARMPSPEPKLTISLHNIPLPEAIRYVAQQAGLKVRRDAKAFVLE